MVAKQASGLGALVFAVSEGINSDFGLSGAAARALDRLNVHCFFLLRIGGSKGRLAGMTKVLTG